MADIGWLARCPIAHRGYHDRAAGRIENTLSAARAALDRDFAIECDLQLTADGEAIVFHDDAFDRLAEASGPVRTRTLAEIRTIRLRDTDDTIPTLAELLATVAGRVPLVIELKSAWNGERGLEARVAPMLAAYRGPAAVMSFDPDSMRAMRRLLPELPRGLVADGFDPDPSLPPMSGFRRFALRNLFAAAEVRPGFVSYGIDSLPAAAPLLLRRLGLTLITWTIRTPADRAKAARYTDQITFEGFDPDA